jgi:DNA-directed RNA polymerase specialized sigma24 family protein
LSKLLGSAAATGKTSASQGGTALPTPIERAYAHRESLFLCAAQLLDDAQAAQQVVAETLSTALLRGLQEPEVERGLDRLLVSLTLVRLKALPKAALRSDGISPPDASLSSDRDERDATRPAEERTDESGGSSQIERTAQVLSALPIEARVLVMLVVMQGRSLAEAAALFGASEDTCRFFLNHGRKLLRRALQRDLLGGDGTDRADGSVGQPAGGTTTLYDLRRSKKAIARA